MSYSNAVYYMDYEAGSDTARSNLAPTAYADNGSGAVRVTCNSTAAYATGAIVDIAGTTGSVYVGAWKVTIIDGTHVDLIGSTFTSNPASKGTMTPRGGSSKTDAWKTMASKATTALVVAGDEIRIMGSPAPASLGSATWTSYDGKKTAVSITSSTNATPIVITLSSGNYATLAPAVGDTVHVTGHTTNTKANGIWKLSAVDAVNFKVTLVNADGTNSVGNGVGGASGTIRKITNCVITLASAVTKAIAVVGNQGVKGNWTPSTNVSCAVLTNDYKEGGECQQISVGASFTTGLAAFFATGTLDLSAYQQVTFWVKQTSGTAAVALDAKMQLCTAVDGTTAVHDLPIPALTLNVWTPVTVDLTVNLNASIKSINWNQLVDRGAQVFQVDCITACKAASSADALNLNSLVGKDVAGEGWWPIQSINDVRVMIDAGVDTLPGGTSQYGYYGTSETVTTYRRETIPITASQFTGGSSTGTTSARVTIGGGWDRSTMTTQNLQTFFDGRGTSGLQMIQPTANNNYVTFERIHGTRMNNIFLIGPSTDIHVGVASGVFACGSASNPVSDGNGISASIHTCYGDLFINANNGGFSGSGAYGQFTNIYIHSCSGGLIWNGGGSSGSPLFCNAPRLTGTAYIRNSGTSGFNFGGMYGRLHAVDLTGCPFNFASNTGTVQATVGNVIESLVVANSPTWGITCDRFATHNYILSGSTTGCTSGSISCQNSASNAGGASALYVRNFTANEATKFSGAANGARIYVEKYAGDANDNRVYGGAGLIQSQTTVRHTASGIAWQFTPTFLSYGADTPLEMPLAQIAVAANALVTVKCFIRRDSLSCTASLLCRGGQLSGVASDVSVIASGAVNTWQEETITFTPTEAGVIEITAQAYLDVNTVVNAYFDDLTVTQA